MHTMSLAPKFKCFEVLSIVSLMSLFSLLLPLLWRKCTPLPVDMEGWSDQEKRLVEDLVGFSLFDFLSFIFVILIILNN